MVAIEIDDLTSVKPGRCKCNTEKSKCTVTCIERSNDKPLLAQRWDADQGLTSWNLAALGMEQRKKASDSEWTGLSRVSFRFQSMEGRLPLLWFFSL